MTISQTPTYNIKVVLNQTGIAADTLRAWERRYGLPNPDRTAGGHRLYSDRDIAIIKWLIAQQEEGLSISHAVDLWNETIASGSDPLADSQPKNMVPVDNMNIEALRSEWLTACFNYDTVTAEQILNQAFASHSIEIACTEIIMRGLFEVGEHWQKGTASVQQEHFASGIATRRLDALISATPQPTRKETIILACPPNEWHAFPLLLTNLFLRRRGWNVIYLGANVPTARIEETIKATKPKLVVLSAQTLVNAVQLREMARTLNKKGIQSAFGGRVFNDINGLAKRVPAHYLGNNIEHAIPAIENLIVNSVPVPKEETVKKATLQLADEYHQHRIQIENTLTHIIASQGQSIDFLETANHFLGDSLIATLELGNLSYLSADMHWLSNLLINHNVSIAILPVYLETYSLAIQQVMGENGKEISNWLNLEAQKFKAGI
ncbi:MAG TPA: MerR family transcriptional regulator [Anaerolineales bacterium]|nr:MerR family transcriptional regulator [Anaerolineales bacterium]